MAPDPDLLQQREPIRIRTWTVAGVGLGTALFLGLSMTGLYLYYRPHDAIGRTPEPARFPEPRVQSDPAGDLRDLQAAQRGQVEGYAWADRERGLVRIPVARAMEALAARGGAALEPLEAPEPGVPLPVRPEATRRKRDGE